MLIGICDDEIMIRKEIRRLCDKYSSFNLTTLEIICFSSGEELLLYQRSIDILFLDIQMKGIDGLQTAEKIREEDDSMIIIFLTGHRSFMQDGYRVRAFRYLLKPITEIDFNNSMIDAMNDLTKNFKAFVEIDGSTRFVKLKDILYIEYVNRVTVVRTKRGIYESTIPICEWEAALNTGDFLRVHKAYIVNLAYIEEVGREAILDNGEKVVVSTRQLGKLKKACKVYRRRNAQ